jgi:hypothetical protein
MIPLSVLLCWWLAAHRNRSWWFAWWGLLGPLALIWMLFFLERKVK